MRFRHKNVMIEVLEGDITEAKVDAIVNPANSYLVMGGGVAGAIKRKGGTEIEKEARKFAPIEIGEAIVTTAGKLPARWVVHSPTVRLPAGRASLESVSLATRAALSAAENVGARSIAFPAMGAGVGGLKVEESVETMLNEIISYIDRGTKLERILLIALGKEALKKFLNASKKVLKVE